MGEEELSKCLPTLRTGNEALQVASTNPNEVLLETSAFKLSGSVWFH